MSNGSSGCMVRSLNEINLSLDIGDRVGLIGGNGAGKSTLLKVLAGVYEPTVGTVTVNGHVGSLLNVGVGMTDEASGYENITLCALLMGYSKEVITPKIEAIAEFSGLGDYLALPVSTYSTGMRMRIAFSIATAFEPEVLLIDEFFGAGDSSFFNKAENRMSDMIETSKVLIMASHTDDLLKRFCKKGLVMESGEIKYYDLIGDALNYYHKEIQGKN
ncbi:MAG: ATP-binding cassette domain-containing protein [Candidatus Sedimenticola sp. 6PFRAG1]